MFLAFSEIPEQKNATQLNALIERDYKQVIDIQLEKIEQASADKKGDYAKELALLYLKDQDQELAFKSFLKALDLTKSIDLQPSYDETVYKKAFSIYLDPSSASPQVTSKKLIKELRPILNERPDQYLLNYFIAIAYANLGKYEEFFNHFYKAYQFDPEHYLAYKTKAVLHIKILERTKKDYERTIQRQLISDHLIFAMQKEPLDTTIYKLLISFSPKEKKNGYIQLCLNKIINDNIIIPRSELMFYVIEASDINDPDLAQRFIDRSKDWYSHSRMITSAQNYLDAHK